MGKKNKVVDAYLIGFHVIPGEVIQQTHPTISWVDTGKYLVVTNPEKGKAKKLPPDEFHKKYEWA